MCDHKPHTVRSILEKNHSLSNRAWSRVYLYLRETHPVSHEALLSLAMPVPNFRQPSLPTLEAF